jgi:hypothetical protein
MLERARSHHFFKKKETTVGHQWLTAVIVTTWEDQSLRSTQTNGSETPSPKKKKKPEQNGLEVWLKR